MSDNDAVTRLAGDLPPRELRSRRRFDGRTILHAAWLAMAIGGFLAARTQPADAQTDQSEPDWLQVEPFDIVRLTPASRSLTLKTFPLELPRNRKPDLPKRDGVLRLRLLDEPESEYELDWFAVQEIVLFSDQVLAAAQRRTAEGKYYEAFLLFQFLYDKYPQTEGLEAAFQQYLMRDALDAFREERFSDALVSLGTLLERTQDKQRIESGLRTAVDRILQQTFADGKYDRLRTQLDQYYQRFGSSVAVTVNQWRQRLRERAEQLVAEAGQMTGDQQAARRRMLCHAALRAWPDVAGAREMLEQIYRRNEVIRVGVRSWADDADAQRLTDWADQRVAELIARPLVEIEGFVEEGVVCRSRLGSMTESDGGRRLTLQLTDVSPELPYQLYEVLQSRCDPSSAECLPWLGRSVARVWPEGKDTLQVAWRRPQLAAAPLLNLSLHLPAAQAPPLLIPFRPADRADAELESAESSPSRTFDKVNAQWPGPVQLVEVRAQSQSDLAGLWTDGQIDVIDRVWPFELATLGKLEDARAVRYRFPSQHWLMINRHHQPLQSKDLRRGLLYGIDRQKLLDEYLLGGEPREGCEVISGPCPAGMNRDDPLGYGYDRTISPRSYDPLLARLLLQLVLQADPLGMPDDEGAGDSQGAGDSTDRQDNSALDTSLPRELTLRLAHPQDDVIQQICELVAKGWKPLGIDCRLRPLPEGTVYPQDDQWDLLFVDVRVREPLSDLQRLFSADGLLPDPGPYLMTAQQALSKATTWDEARSAAQQLHRYSRDDVAILPLWQVTDYAVCRRQLAAVRDDLSGLYEQAENWSWQLPTAGEGAAP